MLGKSENSVFKVSQYWETLKTKFSDRPNVGTS
ncbi:hypothetical protein Barb6XT_02872 [Bacteroidales bacterium Barb6XT]|nr:hypothetical protein Barb6XT_02872 [Bacteroidales bacterium Barb6XT]